MDGTGQDPLTMSVHSEDDDCLSSHSSEYGGTADLMAAAMGDEVTAQLAAAGWQKQHLHGPVGMAAAAAIVSAKKRKRPHSFETNPSIRKRQQNRLLRKLRLTIDEFATRVGQQAVVLVATPGKPNTSFKCFGAKPLEDVVKNLRNMIMEELETALAQQAPPPMHDDPSLYELPPLIIDGIPTPVEKMTQAQLRAFIPLMLKYSTGRGKPGWGRDSTRPPWWPKDLPWANVRMDARPEEEKQKISWTHALRQIVINCYKYHGREDLLPAFTEVEENQAGSNQQSDQQTGTVAAQYGPTVLQTITNPDGTLALIQVDPNNPIITLPDGTTAHVQGVATIHTGGQGDGSNGVHLAEVTGSQGEGVQVEINNVTEATMNQDGQIILTSEDGHGAKNTNSCECIQEDNTNQIRLIRVHPGYPVSVSGVISVPVTSMYQSNFQQIVTNIQQIHTSGDGTMQVESANGGEMETITHQLVMSNNGTGEPQLLQVVSLKDMSKTLSVQSGGQEIKTEEGTIAGDQ